jgi:hypothetical protein
MNVLLPLVNTCEDYFRWMKPEIWTEMEATLLAQGVITQTLAVTEDDTLRFLQEIYEGK